MGTIVCNSTRVHCDACGQEIVISMKKPAHNPVMCPACNEPLYLEDEDGRQLNCHWAALTPKAFIVGEIFGVFRFNDEAQHNRWVNFEARHSEEEIRAAAKAIKEQTSKSAKGLGSMCFTHVIARLEKASGKPGASVPQPRAPIKETEYTIRYVS